ncbi:MAG: fimbrillin family protein [Alistipes sp.]|nr:fimbrillin family protein [Alistipes sp.]
MKNFLWALMLLCGLTTACTQDETTDQPVAVPSTEAIPFRATATIEAEEENLAFRWETDSDRIGLFAQVVEGSGEGFSNIYYAAFSAGEEVQFVAPSKKNSLLWSADPEATYNFQAYYPFSTKCEEVTAIPFQISPTQTGVANELPANKREMLMWDNIQGHKQADGEVAFSLQPICALVKVTAAVNLGMNGISQVTLRNKSGEPISGEGTLNLLTGEVAIGEQGSEMVVLNFEKPCIIPSSGTTFYFLLTPGHAGETLELCLEQEGEQHTLGELKIPEAGLKGGCVTSFKVDYEIPIPESIVLSEHGSANTYLINKPYTQYSFNARVKGNGVARTFNWTANGVEKSAGYTQEELQINPATVKIVWWNSPQTKEGYVRDCPILPESVKYNSTLGMVYFTTPADFVPGNVLMAAYDEAGEILWSWNIWAVEDYDYEQEARIAGRYTVMDRNLGAMAGREAMLSDDPIEAAWAVGNFYQWGNKNPMPAISDYKDPDNNIGSAVTMRWGLPSYTSIDALKKDCSSEPWGAENMIFSYDRTQNVRMLGSSLGSTFTVEQACEEATKYPYQSMANGTGDNNAPYLWMAPGNNTKELQDRNDWHYLWGATSSIQNEKTIYDPCPPGWKVPTADALNYVMAGCQEASNGYGRYNTLFDLYIPYAGQRTAGFGGGQLSGTANSIYIASATPSDSQGFYRGFEGSNGITCGNCYVGAGMQIRCVKEEVAQTASPIGSSSGPKVAFMGDSITEQWIIRGRREFFTENNYIDKGISGTTTSNFVGRFYNDILSTNPIVVVIAGGVNDMANNDGTERLNEDILENIRLMAQCSEDWGCQVIIGSCCPSRDMWWQSDEWKAQYNGDFIANRIIDFNVILKALADEQGYLYADYHTPLKNDRNDLADEYCWGGFAWGLDHVHPNYEGYEVMESVITPLIDQIFNDPNQSEGESDDLDGFDKIEW